MKNNLFSFFTFNSYFYGYIFKLYSPWIQLCFKKLLRSLRISTCQDRAEKEDTKKLSSWNKNQQKNRKIFK